MFQTSRRTLQGGLLVYMRTIWSFSYSFQSVYRILSALVHKKLVYLRGDDVIS